MAHLHVAIVKMTEWLYKTTDNMTKLLGLHTSVLYWTLWLTGYMIHNLAVNKEHSVHEYDQWHFSRNIWWLLTYKQYIISSSRYLVNTYSWLHFVLTNMIPLLHMNRPICAVALKSKTPCNWLGMIIYCQLMTKCK